MTTIDRPSERLERLFGLHAVIAGTDAAAATGPAVESARTTAGGSSDSLADVAMYYYETDLRTRRWATAR